MAFFISFIVIAPVVLSLSTHRSPSGSRLMIKDERYATFRPIPHLKLLRTWPRQPDRVAFLLDLGAEGRCNRAGECMRVRRAELPDQFLGGESGVRDHELPGVVAIELCHCFVEGFAFENDLALAPGE